MDCLRSFNLGLRQATTFSGADVVTWNSSVGGDLFWTCDVAQLSRFNIQGFKNIDLYGVQMTGEIKSQTAALNSHVVVNDWGFGIYLDGTNSLVSGSLQTSPNFWNINVDNVNSRNFILGKSTNNLSFASPIKSLKYVEFQSLQAEGFGAETAGSVALEWDLNFTFYYKYEGE